MNKREAQFARVIGGAGAGLAFVAATTFGVFETGIKLGEQSKEQAKGGAVTVITSCTEETKMLRKFQDHIDDLQLKASGEEGAAAKNLNFAVTEKECQEVKAGRPHPQ